MSPSPHATGVSDGTPGTRPAVALVHTREALDRLLDQVRTPSTQAPAAARAEPAVDQAEPATPVPAEPPAGSPTPAPASAPAPSPAVDQAEPAAAVPAEPPAGSPTPAPASAPVPAPAPTPAPAEPPAGSPTPTSAPTRAPASTPVPAASSTVPRVAVVMTMGALHDGHATLVRAARERVGRGGLVVVTVFVNPLQFGAGEDLDRYPRTLDADVRIAEAAGADVVFAPSVDEVYPGGEPQVRVSAGPMGQRLEGASRPGHFDGMLTVVAKLLHLTRPDVAFFGQKDAQQLALIRRMVHDLAFRVEIVGVPTVREPDGLALSSRNRYLSPRERRTALALSAALFAARDRLAAQQALRARAATLPASPSRAEALSRLGESRAAADAHAVAQAAQHGQGGGAAAVRAAARAVLDEAAEAEPPLALDYLALVDPADFTEVPDDHTGDAVLLVAAKVGTTRLIDNLPLTFGAPA